MPVASGTAIHVLPSVRAQAVGPSAGSASSHSRSAVCSRRRRRPASSSARPSPCLVSSASTATVACGSSGRPAGASLERRRADEAEPVAERHLVGLDHEALDRRDHDAQRVAGVGGVLELVVGGLEALVVEDEVGHVRPHRAEEGLQRGLGVLPRVGPAGRRPRSCR